jgi:hypothetical protein
MMRYAFDGPRRAVFPALLAAAVFFSLADCKNSAARAAEKNPVLVVPAAKSTLQVTVFLPPEFSRSPSAAYELVEEAEPVVRIPVQFLPALTGDRPQFQSDRQLAASIPPRAASPSPRRFRLEPSKSRAAAPGPFTLKDLDGKSLELRENGRPRYVYNYGEITGEKVPVDDARRTRGCYVHPLWDLHGKVLTKDFPSDDYQHHGLFWAWPHVEIGGKDYNLWDYTNIRQKFIRWHCRDAGPVAAVLAVENGWFIGARRVVREFVILRLFSRETKAQSLDVELFFFPLEREITIRGAEEKGYGGLAWRSAVQDAKQALISTARGPAPEDLVKTRLAWADLTYPFRKGDPSGAAIFIPKEHPDYPPSWLVRHYGALCVAWPGIEGKTFPPGRPIHLAYRILIHDASANPTELGAVYADYLSSREARWND